MRRLLVQLLPIILYVAFPIEAITEPGVPFSLPPKKELQKLRSGVLKTSQGRIYFELYPEEAPWHVANFKYLADKGFYKGLRFHLYYPDYIIQGGSPSRDPNDGPGYSLPPEFNAHPHTLGAIAMARLPDNANPQRRSNGSQFYIVIGEASRLDGSFTVFGRVVRGIDVAQKLREGDRIEELIVYVRER